MDSDEKPIDDTTLRRIIHSQNEVLFAMGETIDYLRINQAHHISRITKEVTDLRERVTYLEKIAHELYN